MFFLHCEQRFHQSPLLKVVTVIISIGLMIGIPLTSANLLIFNHSITHSALDSFKEKPYLTVVPGFIECSQTCPLTLNKWQKLYKQNSNFQLVFINIDNFTEHNHVVRYVSAFDDSFKALDLSSEERATLYNQLGFWPGGNLWDSNIAHQPLSFVLQYDKKWNVVGRITTDELLSAPVWEDLLHAK